jgi:ACS family D-galactonate transporter-like MFS transporter
VLTGLGEGVFYSNDRTLIMNNSPVEKRTLGLGVVISGLSIGLTLGVLAPPYLIEWTGGPNAWRTPFIVFAIGSAIAGAVAFWYFRSRFEGKLRLGLPFLRLLLFSVPTFVAIVVIFLLADALKWPEWGTAIAIGVLTVVYVAAIATQVVREGHRRTLFSRDIVLLYIGFIAVLYNLWFFSFWSVQIVKEAAHSSLVTAALTAAFNAGAGIVGFPIGGWIADRQVKRGKGRKPLLLGSSIAYAILIILFGLQIQGGGKPSLVVLSLLLFVSGLFFNGLQPIAHAINGDMVPAEQRGEAFGMLNLISEIGAVASPVVSGLLRDTTGNWAAAVYLAAGLMIGAVIVWSFIRERMPAVAELVGVD